MSCETLGFELTQSIKQMAYAPIALFTFKRPAHTLRTLRALDLNPEFRHSALHIFCDASRRPDEDDAVGATRQIVRGWAHPHKTVHEAPANRGLAASIIGGVTALCADHGRVIVVEDDLVVAPVFLDFLNRALDTYADDPRVMQVSGHMFPVELDAGGHDAVFLPFTTSWGWATWQRAWASFDPDMKGYEELAADRSMRKRFDLENAYPYFAMLKKQKAGKIDSWAIRWYLSVFMREGLVLYPRRSLVSNEGFDGSGTHGANTRKRLLLQLPTKSVSINTISTAIDIDVNRRLLNHLRAARGTIRNLNDWYQRSFVR